MSSGYRINRAADDAAGLSISEKMRMQIRGLDKASKNVNDGISVIQVADGALAEVHSMLDRMKQLSVQAANDVNTDDDRAMIQDEIDQLLTEIDRIGSDTEFNTRKIFQGGYTDILDEHGNPVPISNIGFQDFQLARADLLNYPFTNNSNGKYLKLAVSTSYNYTAATWNLIFGSGSTSNSTIRYSYLDDNGSKVTGYSDIADMSITNCVINNNGADMTADSISIIDADCALPFSEKIKWDSANPPTSVSIGDWTRRTGDWGYYDNLATNLGANTNNRDMAFSLMWDRSLSKGSSTNISFRHGIALASNDSNLSGVTLNKNTSSKFHVNQLDLWIQSGADSHEGMYITIGEMNSGELGLRGMNVTTNANASRAIEDVDNAIEKISSQGIVLGAQCNRLEHAMMVDDGTAENLQAAESRIRDTDMAEEMMKYSKHNILEQTGQAMLANANQSADGILTLLG